MPIVLNGSTGITTEGMNVATIVDTTGTGSPSVPNGFEQMFVLPVGTLMWFTGNTAPGGYLVADGTLHSRATYPDLWSWIVTSGNLAVSDAAWDEGQYSPGDGSTTFRVPKVDDRFIRGKSATRAVGLVEEDAFQGHRHEAAIYGFSNTSGASTSFSQGGVQTASYPSSIVLDPTTDTVNGTPRIANETRPKALTMLPCIKAFDSVVDPSVLNAAEMVSTINGKLDKDQNIVLGTSVAASGTAVDFVGIPEGVKRITVMFDEVSTNGSSPPMVQLGSGNYINSGYKGSVHGGSSTFTGVLHTNGFRLDSFASVSNTRNGSAILSYVGNNRWAIASSMSLSDLAASAVSSGTVLLTGTLDRLRIINQNGTDSFDAGTINISWEF